MSVSVTMNGTTYTIPSTGDTNWGAQVTTWIQATSSSTLQKNGGSFVLTAEVDFGATWGIKVAYLKSKSTNSAGSGVIRLSNTDAIAFRNVANTNDISLIPDAVTDGILNYNSVPLVGTTLTQTLTNKTLSSPVINAPTGITKSDVGLSNVDNTSDATKNAAVATLTNKTLTAPVINSPTGIVKGDVGLGNVDNTSDATKNAAAATLTNKTIDADLNTITNIDNTDIKEAAAIARTKLASGTASHVLINDGSGVMSSEAQLTISRGGTGQSTASAAFDALSPLTTKGDLIVRNASTNTRLPIGSDGQVLVGDSTQALGVKWTSLQQGTKNYLTYNNFENNATTGWNKFNTTLTGVNPTGTLTLTAASITTFATTATNPLAGVYSLNVASSAAWSAGQGIISDAYIIDREDLGSVMRFNFFNEIVSGLSNLSLTGTTTNTFAVWFYDVTNLVWVQPSSCYGLTGTGKVSGEIQLPSSCLSFRLAVLCVNASAGAVSINFDDFSFGPQQVFRGPSNTDPIAYTPTITGFGTVSGVNFKSWKNGKYLEFEGNFTSGTVTAVEAQVTLGFNGTNANVTTSSGLPTTSIAGQWARGVSSTTNVPILLQEPSKNYITFGVQTASYAGLSKRNGTELVGAGDIVSIKGKVEIQGWSSNALLSSDTDTRIVAGRFKTSIARTINNTAPTIIYETVDFDTHGAYDASTGVYTVKIKGLYNIKNNLRAAAIAYSVNQELTQPLKVNGTTVAYLGDFRAQTTLNQAYSISGGTLYSLNVGDTVALGGYSDVANTLASGLPEFNYWSIERVAGPQQIAASAKISFSADTSTTAATTSAPFIFTNKDHDLTNSYSTSTGKFTAPRPDVYHFTANLYSTTASYNINLYKNGTTVVASGVNVSSSTHAMVSRTLYLLTGETIEVRPNGNITASSTGNDTFFCGFSVGS